MFFDYWPVLFVDDEPDVLAVSKLAMKNFEVYGLPLKIYTASSKAEAVALMRDNAEVACNLAVAFLDVVMETDRAGLDLCDHFRKDMGNTTTQIFVRTGQAGLAPEREVIDKYDIAGYFSKTEMTQSKLYSVVKSGVRQYLAFGMAQATIELTQALLAAFGSRERLLHVVHSVAGASERQAEAPRWLVVDGAVLFAEDVDAARALETRRRLMALRGAPLGPYGDSYVMDADGYHLIHVAEHASRSETSFVFKSRFAPPPSIVTMMHSFVTGLAIAWRSSAA